MGRTPGQRKEGTRERIVAAAARSIRGRGYAGVRVAAVMKDAGLTHGGFYAHFKSREALLIEALDRAGADNSGVPPLATKRRSGTEISAFRALVETYLGDRHLASVERGCPVAALACEMPRQSQIVRGASIERVRQLIATVCSALPEQRRSTAGLVAGALVGALQLARALGNNPEGRAALSQARESLIRLYDTESSVEGNSVGQVPQPQPLPFGEE